MGDLLVIVPTLNRPAELTRLAETFQATSTADTDLLAVLDKPYAKLYRGVPCETVVHPSHDAATTTVKSNWVARKYVDDYWAIFWCGDDHTFETVGWDDMLLGAIGRMGGTGFAYPATGRDQTLPEVCCISTNVIKALGWIANPVLRHYYIDNTWKALGLAIGRYEHVPGAMVAHHHWSMPPGMDRAAKDDCYMRSAEWLPGDKIAWWMWWTGPGLEEATAKLAHLTAGAGSRSPGG
jgi:hypothetical protein